MSLYLEGDIPYVANGNCNNNGGFGDGDWIWAFLLFALLGNNGWGIGGGNRGGYDVCCGTPATQADLANGFAQNTLQRGIDDIILGQAQAINYNNQGFAGLNSVINTGFAGVNNAICTLGYQNQAGFNALANQIASCCCDLKTMNLENRYLNERQTCDIVAAINAGNQRLVDIYTTDKLASKDARIAALEAQISNAEQSAYLLNELKPCPKASYLVQPPQPVTFPTNCCGNVAYANYGGCGASVQ